MADQLPERGRIGGPAAADDVHGDARLDQHVGQRSATAQGADLDLALVVLKQSAGQQAQLLRRAAAVERVDDVEDALFQRGCLGESSVNCIVPPISLAVQTGVAFPSRSDVATVAVGFNPRTSGPHPACPDGEGG